MQPKIIFSDSKLFEDHAGGGFNITLDPKSLLIRPHYMANVIHALKAKAGTKQ